MATAPDQAKVVPTRIPGIDSLYLCGPMTGLPHYNYPTFTSVAADLSAVGYSVFNPAAALDLDTSQCPTGREPVEGFDPRIAFALYADYITGTADAVAVLDGWEGSVGARAEVSLALAIGLPILDAVSGRPLDVTTTAHATAPTLGRQRLIEFDRALASETGPDHAEPADPELEQSIARHPAGRLGQEPLRPGLSVVGDDARRANAPSRSTEVRTTSRTGGQKGSKEERYDLIPGGPLRELAVLFGRGNAKYPPEPGELANWKRGYDWSLSKAAMQRHLELFWSGEDYDEEMGVKHLICVSWHAFVLAWFVENRPDFDDRPNETYTGALPTPQWLVDLVAERAQE